VEYHCYNFSATLNGLALHNWRRHFDSSFLIAVLNDTKYRCSALERVGLPFPFRNICNFNVITYSSILRPSAVCALVSEITEICTKP
jgi:hypothetical protein